MQTELLLSIYYSILTPAKATLIFVAGLMNVKNHLITLEKVYPKWALTLQWLLSNKQEDRQSKAFLSSLEWWMKGAVKHEWQESADVLTWGSTGTVACSLPPYCSYISFSLLSLTWKTWMAFGNSLSVRGSRRVILPKDGSGLTGSRAARNSLLLPPFISF